MIVHSIRHSSITISTNLAKCYRCPRFNLLPISQVCTQKLHGMPISQTCLVVHSTPPQHCPLDDPPQDCHLDRRRRFLPQQRRDLQLACTSTTVRVDNMQLSPGESPALAFLSVIPVGNLLLFSHRATTPPWQEPEGQGFNPANNTRTKAPHFAAAGSVFHPSPTPTLSSRPEARFLRRSGETCSFARACTMSHAREGRFQASPLRTTIKPLRSHSHRAATPPWQGFVKGMTLAMP